MGAPADATRARVAPAKRGHRLRLRDLPMARRVGYGAYRRAQDRRPVVPIVRSTQ